MTQHRLGVDLEVSDKMHWSCHSWVHLFLPDTINIFWDLICAHNFMSCSEWWMMSKSVYVYEKILTCVLI